MEIKESMPLDKIYTTTITIKTFLSEKTAGEKMFCGYVVIHTIYYVYLCMYEEILSTYESIMSM